MDAGLVGDRLLSYNLGGIDPVCGKKIGHGDGYKPDEKPKAHLVYEGKSYYFCSEECLNTFKKNPEKYLKKAISRIKAFPKTAKNPEIDIPLRPDVLVVPGYPDAFRKDGREGTIKLEFDVDDTGRTRETRVLESAELSYEKDLQDALSQWTYPPKIQENQRVPFSRSVDLIFESKKIQEPAAQENQPNFSAPSSGLMERIADYCGKLENAALYFICKEKIMEKLEPNRQYARVWAKIQDPFEKGAPGASMGGGAKFGQKNSYTYDYQVIRKESRVSERRILLEENGKAVPDDGAYPKTFRFYVNKAIYGPVGLLSRAEWPFYDYSLLKAETLNGHQTFVIDIRPKTPSSAKPVYGKVWIDKNDGSVLKMSIEAESLAGYERISADYESRGIKPVISIEIVYGFEKNGLRFPSQITLKEAYSDPKEGRVKMSEMTVDYDHYKFFTVGTEIKY
jgi:TonB family protein